MWDECGWKLHNAFRFNQHGVSCGIAVAVIDDDGDVRFFYVDVAVADVDDDVRGVVFCLFYVLSCFRLPLVDLTKRLTLHYGNTEAV